MTGTLYVVATPIGNLADMSRRGVQTLSAVQIIACEDTRRTGTLLSLLDVQRPAGQRLVACHEHNESAVVPQLLEALQQGQDVALVSDAGTPLLNDPGFNLLRACAQEDIPVSPIPGAAAPAALLSVCPLPATPFCFVGFLPARTAKRRAELVQLAALPTALMLFESPHRIADTLQDLGAVLPERRVFVGRELTKQYESFYCGTAAQVLAELQAREALRGEFVLLIEVPVTVSQGLAARDEKLLRLVAAEVGPSKAAKLMAQVTDLTRSDLYNVLQESSTR
ncbi:MAG: 16S rRNA (cytidine(1402)-2'-O)-methyltransferase [Pseudomonadales bacterium]